METIILENEYLRAELCTFGAELRRLERIRDNVNVIWEMDESIWPRTSPVPFPILGGWPEDTYYIEGKPYRMQKNGFARDCEFSITAQTKDCCTLRLDANENTLASYPFRFALKITFSLEVSTLRTSFAVYNLDQRPLLYGVAAHTAFYWPRMSEMPSYLNFIQEENAWGFHPDGTVVRLLEHQRQWMPKTNMFDFGAFSTKDIQSPYVDWCPAEAEYVVRIHRGTFPYLTLWTWDREDATFLCIEPSLSVGRFGLELKQRNGIQTLLPGAYQVHTISYEILDKTLVYNSKK